MLKTISLGGVAAAARGLALTTTTIVQANPPVNFNNNYHFMRTGERLAIQGITDSPQCNGIWTVTYKDANEVTLQGCVAPADTAFAGTIITAAVADRAPFMQGHNAVVFLTNVQGVAGLVGTVEIEGSNQSDAEFQSSPTFTNLVQYRTAGAGTTGNDNYGAVIGALAAASVFMREVRLARFMNINCTAFTSGSVAGQVLC